MNDNLDSATAGERATAEASSNFEMAVEPSSPPGDNLSEAESSEFQQEMLEQTAACCSPLEASSMPSTADIWASETMEESISRIRKEGYPHNNLRRRAAWGALSGGLVSLCLVTLLCMFDSEIVHLLSEISSPSALATSNGGSIRGEGAPAGISSYLNLFPRRPINNDDDSKNLPPIPPDSSSKGNAKRHLAASSGSSGSSSSGTTSTTTGTTSTGSYKDAQLVIAGKMTVEDAPCNIAQFNLKTQEWSLTERIQLSLYNSYSGGEVYSLLANHTSDYTSVTSGTDSTDAKR
jgi:hypothetical protein